MSKEWTAWDDGESPYVHWWHHADGKLPSNARDFVPLDADPAGTPFAMPRFLEVLRAGEDGVDRYEEAKKLAEENYAGGARVPVPGESRNPDWEDPAKRPKDWITDDVRKRLPDDLDRNTVLVAVVDTGVALGHRAFRRADGTTRVISAWQQTAGFRHRKQEYLPFGEEVFPGDINAALRAQSRNSDLGDRLDEEGFNRALRLVEPQRTRGHRDLDHRAAHGTHVMDIAAGQDPQSERADLIRLLAVNLPTQRLHGSAGDFLMYYAAFALNRAFDMAKALWEVNFPGEKGGFPVALNLAYGMMAGAKNGENPLELLMQTFVSQREAAGLATSICLPAGNENLARAVARLDLAGRTASEPIPWRTLPSDRTSNFVELWVRLEEGEPADWLENLRLDITAPSGATYALGGARDNTYHELAAAIARLYCRLGPDRRDPRAVQFLLATSPTLIVETGAAKTQISPAGLWKIRVTSPVAASLSVFVQSDQSATVQSNAGLRSYLDHRCYRRLLDTGRPRDTFSYAPMSSQAPTDQEGPDPLVTRKGSHNALATTIHSSAIGGYRLSDGRPASYSATGARLDAAKIDPIQAAYPCEDSPALYGVLAAGARDGTSVSFRGTSMAAAMATRRAAHAMLAWAKNGAPATAPMIGSADWHAREAAEDENEEPRHAAHYGRAERTKIGSGRAYAPDPADSHRWQHAPRRPART